MSSNYESPKQLRLAIVGSGGMARVHANHWRKIPEVALVAVATRDEVSGRALPGGSDASIFTSIDDALSSPDTRIDIVDICTPTPTHKPLVLAALAAKVHVLLEKPMAGSLQECDAIIAASEAAGSTVMIAHVVRFFPEYAAAHRSVAAGAIGTPATARLARMSAHPKAGWHNWYADPKLSGGVVLDMIVHDFDWLLWTFGPVDRVFAKGLYENPETTGKLDYALVTLHHASGVISHVTGSWAHMGGFRTTFEICGDAGMIEHDSALTAPLSISLREAEGPRAAGVPALENPLSPDDDPYYRELRHFTDCVVSGRKPDITLEDARAAVAVADAALQSISSGEPVCL